MPSPNSKRYCVNRFSRSSEHSCANMTAKFWTVRRPLPATDDRGRALWHKLMVYTSEAALHDGTPIHRATRSPAPRVGGSQRGDGVARHLGIPR